MATTKIPSLDALPITGVDDDLQTVIQARQKLNASFVMVSQILNAPSGVPSELRAKLNTVIFHLTTALSAIDSYLYAGRPASDMAGEVPNLMDAIKSHVQALRQAKPAWDNWLKTAKPPEAPAPLVANATSIVPAIETLVQPKTALKLTEPTPLTTYLTIGGLAVGAFILWKILD